MRSILVDGSNDPGLSTRIESALAVARLLDGDVTVLVDTPVAAYVSTDALTGSALAVDALNQALERDDDRARTLQAALAREDIPCVVKRSEGDAMEALLDAARLADLAVLSRSSALASRAAGTLDVPLLLLPDERNPSFLPSQACVAWDGSAGAAAALRAAAPLLAHCQSVSVITIGDEGSAALPQEATDYLRRHGIAAEGAILDRNGTVAETLEAAIAARGAALLVMGASGHSRMRDLLFGGVARHFLEDRGPLVLLLGARP